MLWQLFLVAICDDPTPPNGIITYRSKLPTEGKYPAGTFVTISCNKQFAVSGPNYRKCQDDGTWSGEATLCKGSNINDGQNRCRTISAHLKI